jgi:hypothetical protein
MFSGGHAYPSTCEDGNLEESFCRQMALSNSASLANLTKMVVAMESNNLWHETTMAQNDGALATSNLTNDVSSFVYYGHI